MKALVQSQRALDALLVSCGVDVLWVMVGAGRRMNSPGKGRKWERLEIRVKVGR